MEVAAANASWAKIGSVSEEAPRDLLRARLWKEEELT